MIILLFIILIYFGILYDYSQSKIITNGNNKYVNDINDIVINKLITYAYKTCGNANEYMTSNQLSIACFNNINELYYNIIIDIVEYIIPVIKNKTDIYINRTSLITDLIYNLNLYDSVLYPLLYTNKYTIYGNTYFTRKMVQYKVIHKLNTHFVINKIFAKYELKN